MKYIYITTLLMIVLSFNVNAQNTDSTSVESKITMSDSTSSLQNTKSVSDKKEIISIQSLDREKKMPDTIYVSNRDKTYISCTEIVEWVDRGIQEYVAINKGKSAFIIATEKDLPPASLRIRYGNHIWSGTVAFKEFPTEEEQFGVFLFAPPKNANPLVNEERIKRDEKQSLMRELVNKRLAKMKEVTKDEEEMGIKSDKKIFKLSAMRKDDEYYYFKLLLYNDSKQPYIIDFVGFTYFDEPEDKSLMKEIKEPTVTIAEAGEPTNEGGNYVAKVKDVAVMYYAIKQFALSKKGYLEVTAREKDGTRQITFNIDQKSLIKMESF